MGIDKVVDCSTSPSLFFIFFRKVRKLLHHTSLSCTGAAGRQKRPQEPRYNPSAVTFKRMGRKGKMSGYNGREEGLGKWSQHEELRNIQGSINYARKTAYDHQIIEKKKEELAISSRRKLIFPHLSNLLSQRARADDRERLTQAAVGEQNWNAQLRMGFAQDREAVEQKDALEKAKKKFYRTIYSEYKANTIQSLSRICVNVVAKNIQHYCAEDVKFALSTVDYRYTQVLSLLSSLHGTLRDDKVVGLTHELSEKVFFSKNITDSGISTYFTAMHNSSKDHFSGFDSWEQIELSDIHMSSCMNLREITLLSSCISTASIRVIDDCCRGLDKLCLHDVQFTKEAEAVDPTVFCLQIFDAFADGFANLVALEVLNCAWVRWAGLNFWSTSVFTRRQSGRTTLPKLAYLALSDFQELGVSYRSGTIGRDEAAAGGYARTVITQLIDYLHINCAIALTIAP